MPKNYTDKVIICSVIGLVAWAIIGLPLLDILQRGPSHNYEDKWYSTFLNHAPDWFVAIFTGLLVYVTYRLVKSTNRLWEAGEQQIAVALKAAEAAELSAKAAIGIELPVIRVPRLPGIIRVTTPPTEENPFPGGIYTQTPDRYGVVSSIEFHNYGRTPAFPIRVAAGWLVTKALPSEPNYFHSIDSSPTAIINPDADFTAAVRAVIELTDEQLEKMRKKEAFLWFYISLHYRDFLNLTHQARFCWRFTKGFDIGGRPAAEYTKHS